MALSLSTLLSGIATRLNRPPKRQVRPMRGVATAALALAPLIAAALIFADGPVQHWAVSLPRAVDAVFQYITEIGRSGWTLWPVGLLILLGLWRWASGPRAFADKVMLALVLRLWFVFASVAGSGLSGSLIKNMIGRARPPLRDTEGLWRLHPFAFRADHASFPSGHAITSAATAAALCLLLPRWSWLWLTIGAAGVLSRIVVNAHYLSDVLAGAAWGVGVTLVFWRLFAARALAFSPNAPYRALPMPAARVSQAIRRLFSR